MSSLNLISGPTATDILTLTEVKNHLRITGTDEDTYLTSLIEDVVDYWRNQNQWEFTNATWDWYMDEFPDAPGNSLRPEIGPLSSVTYVKYYDSNNNFTTLSEGTDYEVDPYPGKGWIVPGEDGWPDTYDRTNAVVIRFVAGYGAAGSPNPVPGRMRRGLLSSCDWWYWHRNEALPNGIHTQMQNQRIFGFGA